jgi:glycosyltransferase involved in cell wall biosynthesis
MRITFVLPTVGMSGGIIVIAIYARALAAAGHQVVLISPPPREPSLREKVRSLVKERKWPSPLDRPLSPLDGTLLDHRILDRWRAPTDEDLPDADVVVATWWETAEWVNALSDAKGVKVYFVQGHEVFDYLPVERCRNTYTMPLAKIVVSKWLANVIQNEYGASVLDIVPNSVDRKVFHASRRGKQGNPTVGFLYNRAPNKAVDLTLKVITALRTRFQDLRVLAFGAETPAGESDFPCYIEFRHLPAKEEIRDLYAQCDVWLSTSRSEGFNMTVMEAMACRTPAVATRTGWPVEAIETGRNGFLADVDDMEGIVAGAISLLSLPDEDWRAASDRAHATVADSSWDVSANRFARALALACKQ